jgi:hypothetical protein
VTAVYVECPQCGKRALSVATRCPHCGHDFPARPLHVPMDQPARGASRTALAASATVIVLAVLALYVRPREPRRDASPRAAHPPQAASDTASPRPTATSVSAPDRVAALPDTTPPVRSPSPAGARRYALTWVNIHGKRTQSSPTVGILNPGDPVLADSLVRGWYRVSVEGRILGYVYRSMLDVAPPP